MADRLTPQETITLLRATLDATHDGILAVDLHHLIVACNQPYLKLSGFTREQLEGRCVDAVADAPGLQVENAGELLIGSASAWSAAAQQAARDVHVISFRDGRLFERSVSPCCIDHTTVGFVATFRDISESARTAEAREQQRAFMEKVEDQLRQSQKIETIGRLAGGIAHDLNNALTAIAGYSELALGQLAASHPARADVEEIRRGAERAGSVTRQLLAFSRKELLEPRLFDLNQTISALGRLLSRLLGTNIQVRTELAPAVPAILGDRGQFEQAVINLAVNARDAMPGGGRLLLATSVEDLDEAFARAHTPMTEGRYVVLRVSDTGNGMSEETRARVFEPFFTTKPPGKGTGLGLSMVYGTLKQIGGFIFADSEVGRGTTFRLYLRPAVSHERSSEPASTQPADEPDDRSQPTVLVVEDEPSVRTLIASALRGDGYRVLLAGSAEEALRIADAHPSPIHLLLTDAIMPGQTGIELAHRLAAERPELRVIVISGHTEETLSGLDAEFDLLRKPFAPRELQRRVHEALDHLREQPR